MINVSEWIKEYESLIVLEDEEDENFLRDETKKERLRQMRFKLTSILWGCNLN